METEVTRYGVKEQQTANTKLDVHLEEIRVFGYTILDSGFDHVALADFKSRLDNILARQSAEAGDDGVLASIGERNTARALLAYDETFLKLALHPQIQEICRRLLGEYFILMLQNATINPPNEERHHQSAYHRDLPYQHFVSSRPLAVNALLCLDPFSRDTGSTFVLPCSHKAEAFPSDDYVRKMELPITAPVGSFIVFDSMLYHRAGLNISENHRYAINLCYSLPILKQQISLPALLGGKWSENAALARLLGYESEPVHSVLEWQQQRLRRRRPI